MCTRSLDQLYTRSYDHKDKILRLAYLFPREIIGSQLGQFHLSINSNSDFMDVGVTSVTFEPGLRLEIAVDADIYKPADHLKGLSLETRQERMGG